jgi:phospholipase A1
LQVVSAFADFRKAHEDPYRMFRSKSVIFSLLMSGPAFALEQPATLAGCAGIVDNVQRLECFDRLAANSMNKDNEKQRQADVHAQPLSEHPAAAGNGRNEHPETFSLADHWELGPENKRGTFIFRPHRENYLLFANYSSSPNNAPYLPFSSVAPQLKALSRTELAFQLGFKMKLLENALDQPVDLWFGYTQQSYWQAYNRRASSPFRETNYQPELMAVVPVNLQLPGMNVRFINFGLAHQSNGQTSTLSRSWNRLYVQAGMENGNFTLLARIWKRVGTVDDNPDITDYMGYGDVMGTYRWRAHEFFVRARNNFSTSRGAAQIGWAFPLGTHLKGYVQLFSGYGQSLIDYNHSQTTIGLGILVNY